MKLFTKEILEKLFAEDKQRVAEGKPVAGVLCGARSIKLWTWVTAVTVS
jgi:hypothetical protein